MSEPHTQENDPFVERLKARIVVLQQCQKEKGVSSCTLCDKLLDCEVRNAYVSAVYDSMSKGETGGFEF